MEEPICRTKRRGGKKKRKVMPRRGVGGRKEGRGKEGEGEREGEGDNWARHGKSKSDQLCNYVNQ